MSSKRLASNITSYTKDIESRLNKLHHKISKKSVHDLRIAIRRTRAIFWVIRRGQPDLKLKLPDRRLRKLIKELGKIRELDVAIEDAKSYHIKCSKLKGRRKEIRKSISDILSKKGFGRIRKNLIADSKEIKNSGSLRLNDGISKLREDIEKWAGRKVHQKSDFHRLRIMVKRVRYILEAMENPERRLVVLQDKLGKMHDLEVLQNLLGRNLQVTKNLSGLKQEIDRLIPRTLPCAIEKLYVTAFFGSNRLKK